MTRIVLALLLVLLVVMLLRALRPTEPDRAPRADAPPTRMTREEALAILGLKEGASREQVLAAYKSLIRKVHPDSPGGSDYLASKLNQAKQTLIG